ncbi:TPA: transposase, partial [Neisseria meningitidis]
GKPATSERTSVVGRHYARAAYFGLIKVSAQSHLKAMCLNLLKAANRLSAPAAA